MGMPFKRLMMSKAGLEFHTQKKINIGAF